MSQFSNEMKTIIRKLQHNQASEQDIDLLMQDCKDKISDFQLYSLALKYYSYIERNIDLEDMLDDLDEEHEHSHHHNHEGHDHESHNHEGHDHEGHNHESHNHEDHDHHHKLGHESIVNERLNELKLTFDQSVEHMAREGKVPSVNELLDLREELKEEVAVLTAYGDQISLLENVYYKSRYNDENMMVMESDDVFARRVTEFLMDNENSSEIREHLKVIYPELPMRMTKGKFFSFVDEYFNRMRGIPMDDIKNHIQLLKETFDPTSVENYGEIAPEINEELIKVKETILNGDTGEKDSAYHHMYHLTEDKNDILELGLDISELLNHVLALALVNVDTEKSRVFKVIKPLLEGSRDEMALAAIFEDVESNYEPLGEDLLKVAAAIDQLEQAGDLLDHFNKRFDFGELRFDYELTKEGYFIERPHEKDETIPTNNELTMMKNELIGHMESVLSGESRAMKRGRMSLMMGIFQIVHTRGQDIYDHIYQSIETCDVKGEKVMSMQNIYAYINNFMD